jgi:hypothetical protein
MNWTCPHSYIFNLSDGSFAVVEAPWGGFHLAYEALKDHMAGTNDARTVTESHSWQPDEAGWNILHSNGEMTIKLVIVADDPE